MNPTETDNTMPKRTPSTEEKTKILQTLAHAPWKYSERTLNEFIDQNHADYGELIRGCALEVNRKWNEEKTKNLWKWKKGQRWNS